MRVVGSVWTSRASAGYHCDVSEAWRTKVRRPLPPGRVLLKECHGAIWQARQARKGSGELTMIPWLYCRTRRVPVLLGEVQRTERPYLIEQMTLNLCSKEHSSDSFQWLLSDDRNCGSLMNAQCLLPLHLSGHGQNICIGLTDLQETCTLQDHLRAAGGTCEPMDLH